MVERVVAHRGPSSRRLAAPYVWPLVGLASILLAVALFFMPGQSVHDGNLWLLAFAIGFFIPAPCFVLGAWSSVVGPSDLRVVGISVNIASLVVYAILAKVVFG